VVALLQVSSRIRTDKIQDFGDHTFEFDDKVAVRNFSVVVCLAFYRFVSLSPLTVIRTPGLLVPQLINTVIYMIQATISYFLMLAVMCFNGYVFISVILGLGVGYFFFGMRRPNGAGEEECH